MADYEIKYKEKYDEIQEAAESLQKLYFQTVEDNPDKSITFNFNEELQQKTTKLYELILKYPSGEFSEKKRKETHARTFVSIMKTIPTYEKNKDGRFHYYLTYFRKDYERDTEKFALAEDSYDEAGSVQWRRNEFNKLGDDSEARRIRTTLQLLKNRGIDIFGKGCDKTVDDIVDILYKAEYAKHDEEKEKEYRQSIRKRVMIILEHGYTLYLDNEDEVGMNQAYISYDNLQNCFSERTEEAINFFKTVAGFLSNYVVIETKKNKKVDEKSKKIIHCFFTNDVSENLRAYVRAEHKEIYGAMKDYDISKEEKTVIIAGHLEESFRECRRNVYKYLLNIDYLRHTLEETEDSNLEHIKYVCLNSFRVVDGKERSFTDRNIEAFIQETEGSGGSRGSISSKKESNRYGKKYIGLMRDLKEYYGLG